jgi:hypothetical protein
MAVPVYIDAVTVTANGASSLQLNYSGTSILSGDLVLVEVGLGNDAATASEFCMNAPVEEGWKRIRQDRINTATVNVFWKIHQSGHTKTPTFTMANGATEDLGGFAVIIRGTDRKRPAARFSSFYADTSDPRWLSEDAPVDECLGLATMVREGTAQPLGPATGWTERVELSQVAGNFKQYVQTKDVQLDEGDPTTTAELTGTGVLNQSARMWVIQPPQPKTKKDIRSSYGKLTTPPTLGSNGTYRQMVKTDFEVKALILWCSAKVEGAASADMVHMVGFGSLEDNNVRRNWCEGVWQKADNTFRSWQANQNVFALNLPGGTTHPAEYLASWRPTHGTSVPTEQGFALDWSVLGASQVEFHYLALGGYDLQAYAFLQDTDAGWPGIWFRPQMGFVFQHEDDNGTGGWISSTSNTAVFGMWDDHGGQVCQMLGLGATFRAAMNQTSFSALGKTSPNGTPFVAQVTSNSITMGRADAGERQLHLWLGFGDDTSFQYDVDSWFKPSGSNGADTTPSQFADGDVPQTVLGLMNKEAMAWGTGTGSQSMGGAELDADDNVLKQNAGGVMGPGSDGKVFVDRLFAGSDSTFAGGGSDVVEGELLDKETIDWPDNTADDYQLAALRLGFGAGDGPRWIGSHGIGRTGSQSSMTVVAKGDEITTGGYLSGDGNGSGGQVLSRSSQSGAAKGGTFAFDYSTNEFWRSNASAGGEYNSSGVYLGSELTGTGDIPGEWIAVDLGAGKERIARSFSIWPSITGTDRDPKKFHVFGSNVATPSDPDDWGTPLVTVSGFTGPVAGAWKRQVEAAFGFSNSTAYRHYRLVIEETNNTSGTNPVEVSRFHLFEAPQVGDLLIVTFGADRTASDADYMESPDKGSVLPTAVDYWHQLQRCDTRVNSNGTGAMLTRYYKRYGEGEDPADLEYTFTYNGTATDLSLLMGVLRGVRGVADHAPNTWHESSGAGYETKDGGGYAFISTANRTTKKDAFGLGWGLIGRTSQTHVEYMQNLAPIGDNKPISQFRGEAFDMLDGGPAAGNVYLGMFSQDFAVSGWMAGNLSEHNADVELHLPGSSSSPGNHFGGQIFLKPENQLYDPLVPDVWADVVEFAVPTSPGNLDVTVPRATGTDVVAAFFTFTDNTAVDTPQANEGIGYGMGCTAPDGDLQSASRGQWDQDSSNNEIRWKSDTTIRLRDTLPAATVWECTWQGAVAGGKFRLNFSTAAPGAGYKIKALVFGGADVRARQFTKNWGGSSQTLGSIDTDSGDTAGGVDPTLVIGMTNNYNTDSTLNASVGFSVCERLGGGWALATRSSDSDSNGAIRDGAGLGWGPNTASPYFRSEVALDEFGLASGTQGIKGWIKNAAVSNVDYRYMALDLSNVGVLCKPFWKEGSTTLDKEQDLAAPWPVQAVVMATAGQPDPDPALRSYRQSIGFAAGEGGYVSKQVAVSGYGQHGGTAADTYDTASALVALGDDADPTTTPAPAYGVEGVLQSLNPPVIKWTENQHPTNEETMFGVLLIEDPRARENIDEIFFGCSF